jgi:hypothetical protein
VERDIEAWYKSFATAIIANLFDPVKQRIASLDVGFLRQLGRTMITTIKGYWEANTKQEVQNNARAVYRKHYDTIRQLKHRSVSGISISRTDGGHSVTFLGEPIPDCPFPRVNDSEAMQERVRLVMRKRLGVVVQKAVIFVGALRVALVSVYWYRK